MFRLIKNEFDKLKIPVVLATAILSITAIALSCTMYKGYSLFNDIDAWEVGTEIINFLFPLFAVIPICWNVYYERKNSFLLYTMPRVGKTKYLTAKWIAAVVSAFTVIFVPYFLSAVFALYIKPPIKPLTGEFTHIYLNMYVNAPLLYALLLSLWKGVVGVLVMNLGFLLSLYVKNIFVILTGPFTYSILENFSLSILGVPQYRLVTSFEPSAVDYKSISAFSPAVGPLLIVAFTVFVWLFFAKVKREAIYQV